MSSGFKTVGVIGRCANAALTPTLAALGEHLWARGMQVAGDESSAPHFGREGVLTLDRQALIRRCDLLIVVGGDGTFLEAARLAAGHPVPLLGVNLGRLGFLVDIRPERLLPTLDEILAGRYLTERRLLLEGEVWRRDACVHRCYALNEVVIHKRDVSRIIELDTYIDGRYVSKHRADGLVIATPTGSTAYALSSGGPVMHPGLDALAVVPVSPHTLSARPVVVAADSKIEVMPGEHNHNLVQVSWDGQESLPLEPGDHVRVVRASAHLHLIHPMDYDYFAILRNKLHWGGDHHLR